MGKTMSTFLSLKLPLLAQDLSCKCFVFIHLWYLEDKPLDLKDDPLNLQKFPLNAQKKNEITAGSDSTL